MLNRTGRGLAVVNKQMDHRFGRDREGSCALTNNRTLTIW